MYTVLIIITLQLFPSGVVKRTVEEVYLADNQVCMAELHKVNHFFDTKNENKDYKLLSVACSQKGEM